MLEKMERNTFIFSSLVMLGIEARGILPLRYALSPILNSFILKQGLTKLQRASLSS